MGRFSGMDRSGNRRSVPGFKSDSLAKLGGSFISRNLFYHLAVLLFCAGLPLGAQEPLQENGPLFSDETEAVGLSFRYFNGMTGAYYVPEEIGPGVALLDFDNDGDLDVYLVQGNLLGPDKTLADAIFKPDGPLPLTDRLFRNDLKIEPDGTRRLRFTDITEKAGIRSSGYGIGVAVGDYDNDGHPDLYITNFGANQMWRNKGDGRFEEVSAKAGTADGGWSVSATFFDFDRDGWLDLFVTNYVKYDFQNHKSCLTPAGIQDYCGPDSYGDAPDKLYRNRGDGSFEDVTYASGIYKEYGSGLGVIAADLNQDGWLDLYVANDADPNLLWINQKNGRFVNEALLAGCALNAFGATEASMGIDAGDVDGDGDLDLFMTHLTGESHTLYINDGEGFFEDQTAAYGLGRNTLEATGFGSAWFDYDNDGWLDLMVANGTVMSIEALVQAKDPYPLHQHNQLFRNLKGSRFQEVTAAAGPAFKTSEVSRGAAFGDVDNDGDSDILLANNNGPTRLLINQIGHRRSWLGLRLVDPALHRDATSARVGLERAGKPTLWRWVRTDGSFASANDPRLLFGLGTDGKADRLRVIWPDGSVEIWEKPPIGRYITLEKGSNKKP